MNLKKKKLVRIDKELYRATKIACAVQDSRIGSFATSAADRWSDQEGLMLPGVAGSQQVQVPTYEDLDVKMRIRAAQELGGVPVGVAYGSALVLGVAELFESGKIHEVSIEASNIVGEHLDTLTLGSLG